MKLSFDRWPFENTLPQPKHSALPVGLSGFGPGILLLWFIALGVFSRIGPASLWAMPPEELQTRLNRSEPITVVDIRSQALFQKGHIPGAINIPASLLADKKLPPVGRVIVCGDGLGRHSAEQAAAELNRKPGVTAELLDGGYAAWEMILGGSTRLKGLQPEDFNFISFQELKAAPLNGWVVVDLRQPKRPHRFSMQSLPQLTDHIPFTDLQKKFPRARIVKSPFDARAKPQSLSGAKPDAPPTYVLIDNNDGQAQEMARALKANGMTRVLILAGGEEILARDGRAGLERSGPGPELKPISR